MAYHPNIPTPTGVVQDELTRMRENFQHLDSLAQAVGELQAVSELAPYVQALLDSRIIEMGSNANGEYVRWENGLQICFVRGVAFTGDGTSDEKTGSWTHPAAFASLPVIVGRNAGGGASPVWQLEVNPSLDAGGITRTEVSWRAYRPLGGFWPSGTNYYLHYIAIGRWK